MRFGLLIARVHVIGSACRFGALDMERELPRDKAIDHECWDEG